MAYSYCPYCRQALKKQKDKLVSCPRCHFVDFQNPRVTVTALILHQNKLLLTKRAKAPLAGCWDLPGGFMNKEETPLKALKRELREETGIRSANLQLFGFYPGTYRYFNDLLFILSIAYRGRAKSTKLVTGDDVKEARWFSKRELPQNIAFDSNQLIIKHFLKVWK